MDEKLKNQVLISVVTGGFVFMVWMFWRFFTGDGGGLMFDYVMGFVLGGGVGGGTFGVLYFVQKE